MGFCESRIWDIRIPPASGSGRDNLRKPFRPKTTDGTPEPSPERGFFLPFSCFCLASSPSGSILHVVASLFNPIVMLKNAMSLSSKAIGTKAFRRWAGDEIKRLAGQVGSPVDVAMRRIETGMDPEEVIGLVCEMCEVDEGDLTRRRSLDNVRLLTIKLLLESTGLTQRAIGQMVGMKDGSGLGRLMTRFDERLKKSRKLKKKLKDLRVHCGLNH